MLKFNFLIIGGHEPSETRRLETLDRPEGGQLPERHRRRRRRRVRLQPTRGQRSGSEKDAD